MVVVDLDAILNPVIAENGTVAQNPCAIAAESPDQIALDAALWSGGANGKGRAGESAADNGILRTFYADASPLCRKPFLLAPAWVTFSICAPADNAKNSRNAIM